MLKELTESEVTESTSSTVDETALGTLNRQGSRGITIVSSQSQIIFDIQDIPYWPKWQTKRSELTAKEFETSEFHQDTWNRYLMFRLVSAHNLWNAILNRELRWSYKALCDVPVLPSYMTLRNIFRREHALTVDGIKTKLVSQNKVNLALDGWTSKNKLATTSVIAANMDRNWALHAV